MKPVPTMIERMAEAYWNAFRDGYIAVGGRPETYPTWQQSRDPQKDETIRCLRHAMQAAFELDDAALEAGQVINLDDEVGKYEFLSRDEIQETWQAVFEHLFPDAPQPRKLRPTPTDQAFLTQTEMGNAFDA